MVGLSLFLPPPLLSLFVLLAGDLSPSSLPQSLFLSPHPFSFIPYTVGLSLLLPPPLLSLSVLLAGDLSSSSLPQSLFLPPLPLFTADDPSPSLFLSLVRL